MSASQLTPPPETEQRLSTPSSRLYRIFHVWLWIFPAVYCIVVPIGGYYLNRMLPAPFRLSALPPGSFFISIVFVTFGAGWCDARLSDPGLSWKDTHVEHVLVFFVAQIILIPCLVFVGVFVIGAIGLLARF